MLEISTQSTTLKDAASSSFKYRMIKYSRETHSFH